MVGPRKHRVPPHPTPIKSSLPQKVLTCLRCGKKFKTIISIRICPKCKGGYKKELVPSKEPVRFIGVLDGRSTTERPDPNSY